MDHLNEKDYSELIGYLIERLREYQATDIIRQIKELETVNVIEAAAPVDEENLEEPVDEQDEQNEQCAMWEMSSSQNKNAAKKRKKVVKVPNQEAVSEYHSRPMTCKEIYFAAINILEDYVISVPKIFEQMEKRLQLGDLSKIVWENEAAGPIDTEAPVDIISAVSALTPETQAEMKKSIQSLKSISGKERV